MACALIWEKQGVVFQFSGVASDHDLRQSYLDAINDPRFETLKYQIVDFTDVATLDFSPNIVRWGAHFDLRTSKRNPSIRVAIVGEQLLLMGLANMYRIHFDIEGGTWEQGQFATVDEARAWLTDEDQRGQER